MNPNFLNDYFWILYNYLGIYMYFSGWVVDKFFEIMLFCTRPPHQTNEFPGELPLDTLHLIGHLYVISIAQGYLQNTISWQFAPLHPAPLNTLWNILKNYHVNTLYLIAHLHTVLVNLHAIFSRWCPGSCPLWGGATTVG